MEVGKKKKEEEEEEAAFFMSRLADSYTNPSQIPPSRSRTEEDGLFLSPAPVYRRTRYNLKSVTAVGS